MRHRARLTLPAALAMLSACSGPALSPGHVARSPNPVVVENGRPGQADWFREPTSTGISGYATATSVAAGRSLAIAVSTTSPSYSIDVFRIGWYGGAGARLLQSVRGLTGQDHGQWQPGAFGVQGCPTCTYEPDTGLLQLDWPVSFTLAVPRTWISGSYVARLSTDRGLTGYVPFVVRDARPSAVLAVLPVNTYQAYNVWGGKSLYPNSFGPNTLGIGDNAPAALQVSFERPFASYQTYVKDDYRTVSFMEREGYDVTYATSVDLDRDRTGLLAGHRVLALVGHDEYWSRGMRDTVESGRDHGLGVLFLSGNDVYWQARYRPDRLGRDREVLVCYRSAAIDPVMRTEPEEVTVRWVEPPVSRSQDSLTGTLYTGRILARPTDWIVAGTAPGWLLAGTGLRAGSWIPGLVGIECDGVVTSRSHPFGWQASRPPPGLVLVSDSPVVTASGTALVSNTVYYRTAGGGQVFSVGTWSWQDFLSGPGRSPAVVRMTENVFRRFGS